MHHGECLCYLNGAPLREVYQLKSPMGPFWLSTRAAAVELPQLRPGLILPLSPRPCAPGMVRSLMGARLQGQLICLSNLGFASFLPMEMTADMKMAWRMPLRSWVGVFLPLVS